MAFGFRRRFGRKPAYGRSAKKLVSTAPTVGRALWKAGKTAAKVAIKNRFKGGKTRTLPVFKNVKVEGTGGQISAFKARAKPNQALAMMKKTNASNYLYWNAAQRLTAPVGSQAVYAYPVFAGQGFTSTETQYTDLSTMSYKVSSLTSGPAKSTMFGVESAVAKWMFTNQDSGNLEMHIYDIVTKRDNSTAPDVAWYQGLTDEVSTSINNTQVPIGSVPQCSQLFNVNYKVKQHTRVILGQGQSHCHYVGLSPNKVFRSEILSNSDFSFAGWTYYCLIVISGLPTNDSTNTTSVSTGAASVDMVYSKQMRYTWSADAIDNYFYSQNLPTSFTNGESIMGIGQGVKITDAPA